MPQKRYNIIYEDNYIIAVEKPAGTLVIPTPKNEKNTLTNILNEDLDKRGIEANAYPCHRLDRDTSGVMLYAKGKAVQKIIMDEFKKRQVKKTYIAFVQGIVKDDQDTLKDRIYNKNKNRPELAITHYEVLERRNNFTILKVTPVTGRRNQIRIQLKKIGHPLIGEDIYAFRKDFKLRFKRVALHSQSIQIIHPAAKKPMSFNSTMPADMQNFLSAWHPKVRIKTCDRR